MTGTRTGSQTGFWADLFGASERWGRTILFGAVAGRLLVIPIAAVIYGLAPDTTEDGYSGVLDDLGFVEILDTVVIAPLFESLIIMCLVWFFGGLLRAPRWLTAVLTGAAFVPMHGWVLVSLTVFPIFALMAAVQFNWRRKGRVWTGFWIITAIHALGNLSAVGFAAAGRLA